MQEPVHLIYSKVMYYAYTDWLEHLSTSPQKLLEISKEYECTRQAFLNYFTNIQSDIKCSKCISIGQMDHRFKDKMWSEYYPFNIYSQLFLSYQHILNEISSNVPGVSPHHEQLVNFTLRQLMDMFSPSNFPWTNPVVIKASIEQSGMNFAKGYLNYQEDVIHYLNHQPPAGTEEFKVGLNLAITPGKVIYRNRLIELIQYTPTTDCVCPEPILIVPAWIMKYYILDLSPYNSMVKYLVDQGHTVFMISWKNPDTTDANLSLDDYMNLGVMSAINVINHIIPKQKIHCTGYCIGGTLLMLASAYMAARSDDRVKTITIFAAQVDFKEAGELCLFIDEEQIDGIEKIMQKHGYLSGEQMSSCFSMLHAQDLIWSRYIQDYLLGARYPFSDMMTWNSDTTRLPYKMHSEYLRKLYLINEFASGKYKVKAQKLSIADIEVPIFAVSTVKDHVAPWKSVYKIHNLSKTDVTYILTRGGHNSGIISEPNHKDRSYQMLEHKKLQKPLTPDVWQEKAPQYDGSWWLAWEEWLSNLSGAKVALPSMGSADYKIICDAPGTYVLQR